MHDATQDLVESTGGGFATSYPPETSASQVGVISRAGSLSGEDAISLCRNPKTYGNNAQARFSRRRDIHTCVMSRDHRENGLMGL
jgi:hypothetical protein